MSGLGVEDLLLIAGLPTDFLRRAMQKPARYSFRVKVWNSVTGEIYAMRDPMRHIHLDLSEMVIFTRWPWGEL